MAKKKRTKGVSPTAIFSQPEPLRAAKRILFVMRRRNPKRYFSLKRYRAILIILIISSNHIMLRIYLFFFFKTLLVG